MEYPLKPEAVDQNITNPSKAFIRETYKVSASIVGFILVYLTLFSLAVSLALGAGYLGYLLVISKPGIYSIMLGIALCLFGVFIIYFLIKFITTQNKHDTSHLHEISRSEEPELFDFIEKVATEVGTDFPKKIFLSNEVNAYVFYDSNFWSLFIPVKKNLTIGLGLINSINTSEFKAILAHEFGHFSQKSMKLGSYIYYVNRVIHDMLYNNSSFEESVTKISSSNIYFAISGWLTFLVIRIIQGILKLVYMPINTMYLSLSRQMEFHADAVAASVAGGNHLITSLRRIEMSELCFNILMGNYNDWGFEHVRAKNIYQNHKEVEKHYAKDHDLEFVHDNISTTNDALFISSPRVKITDQWASHPSLEQRTEALRKLNLTTEIIASSPWKLFVDPIATQENFTANMFNGMSKGKEVEVIDNEAFVHKYYESFRKFELPKEFHGFFNEFFPQDISIEEIEQWESKDPIDHTLSKTEIKKLKERTSILNDLNMLQSIVDGQTGIKSFDFDGRKYRAKQAGEVLRLLKKESQEVTDDYKKVAKNIFKHYYNLAQSQGQADVYKDKYQYIVDEFNQYDEDYKICEAIQAELMPIFHEEIKIERAIKINANAKQLEVPFKETLKRYIELGQLEEAPFKVYFERDPDYFTGNTFREHNLEFIFTILNKFIELRSNRLFDLKKAFLEYQVSL